MLEIIGILIFTNRIRTILEEKGYKKSCLYQGLVVGMWFLGEIIGLLLGINITKGGESQRYISYIFAIIGAIVFSMIIYIYVSSFPEKEIETDKESEKRKKNV